ncbi:MAG TPA: carboxypeptidase-like regulatory domain-containing protein [Pyrinomonadaceae bacterium]|nr:carboxypeptidase-like regulatory domain-containing protein [Pyrinomonadaceae bacterium]
MRKFLMLGLALSLALIAFTAHAQTTTGKVTGTVVDPQGAVVPGAKVTITKKSTTESKTTTTSDGGTFEFTNLTPGTDYTITVEGTNFKKAEVNDVAVQINQPVDVPVQLQAGQISETVTVSAGGAELVQTTTADLSKGFDSRQVVELAQTNVGGAFGGGVNNLALIAPNVSSTGGVGVGTGGAVGGQRPRNNNFMLDGIDNNDKSVTGPQSYVSPENVAEFSLLQNQFSAEYARSNGGQFITITKSGTNDYHGSVYGFIRNRYLNALDTLQKNAGITRNRADGDLFMPRSDFFRGGFNMGGPVPIPNFTGEDRRFWSGKDKLFFYFAYERLQQGAAASAGNITTPTAAGFTILNGLPAGGATGVSATNRGVLNTYVPVAPTSTGTIQVCSVRPQVGTGNCVGGTLLNVPVGDVAFPAPNFLKQNNGVINIDWNQSENTTHRFRFNMTNFVTIDTAANLPVFFATIPGKQRLFSYSNFHGFTSNLSNEFRLAFRRSEGNFPVGPQLFPGLTVFPNIGLGDLGLDIGPDPNAPQKGIENNYQLVDNMTYLWGNHSIKFGGDFRKIISPQGFTQRERGDYQYSQLQYFLYDLVPNLLGERSVGVSPYYGDQKILYTFIQDDWRIRPNLTLNMGVNHSYQEVPKGANAQRLNAIASVPGLITFGEPKEQMWNFGPRVGMAWSPNYNDGMLGTIFGNNGRSSIRAGFSMAYDYIFDNLYILAPPPQVTVTLDVPDLNAYTPGFIAGGALPDTAGGPNLTAAQARALTGSWIPDQEVPYSLTWTLSFQRQFMDNWSLETRYLGTKGVHLLTQNRINKIGRVAPTLGRPGLPTFLTTPTQAQLDALPLTLAQINARSNFVPRFANAGFGGTNVIGFLSNGNSNYHAASAQLTRRFADGFQMTAAYTWSHLIDDTTAEVFSTVLSPRRVQEFQDLSIEKSDSALDRRHRFVFSSIYELPWFKNDSNKWVRSLLGGFQFSGTWTLESGEKATVLSGVDANGNGDAAPDRAIINPNGVDGTFSTVTALTNTAGQTVAYRADNPNARYIRAGSGAVSNSGRNTLQMPGINNVDFSIFKNFRIGEGSKRFQLRADFFNAFNHPQYIPGSPNDVAPIGTTGVAQYNTIFAGNTDFNRADTVFSSNPRVIQLAARFNW